MIAAVSSAFASYWRRNPLELVTLIGGLALATALWSGVQAINAEARASYDAAARMLSQSQYPQIIARDGEAVSLANYATLRRAGWQVSPVLEGDVFIGDKRFRLIGLEPLSLRGQLGPSEIGDQIRLEEVLQGGVLFAARGDVSHIAAKWPGRVMASGDVAPGSVITDIAEAARLLERPEGISRLILLAEPPARQLADLTPGLVLQDGRGSTDMTRLTASFHLNLTAFGALSFIVGLFIVQSAIGLSFESRKGMLRSLRLLGVPLRVLLAMMAAELLALALIAGLIGLALGLVLASLLMPDVALSLRGLFGVPVSEGVRLRVAWVLPGLGIAVLGTAIAGAGAMWRLSKLTSIGTGQAEQSAVQAERLQQRIAGLGVLLALVAGVLAARGGGLEAGFATVALGFIGTSLALPWLLSCLLAWAAPRFRGPLMQWLLADTRHMIPGLRLALMALLLAMAANVGVSTMVSSFRLTFEGFLEQRLAADLYVSATQSAPQSLDTVLSNLGLEVQPILHAESGMANLPIDVMGVRVGNKYRETWRFLSGSGDVWSALEAGMGAFINEQLAYRHGIAVGDNVKISEGREWEVLAIIADYGNTDGRLVLDEKQFGRLFPEVAAQGFGVITSDAEATARVLVDMHHVPRSDITDQAALKAASMQIFERTFAVTGALNVLTLAVAAFALLMSLLTLASMRIAAVAPLWAMGIPRQRLAQFELLRMVVLASLTGIVAMPLGLALAWVLLNIVNVAAFGWRLPMHLFPLAYVQLFTMMIMAAVLAAFVPSRMLARMAPARLLGVFGRDV